jgi:tetratricopeptide (TPR) repeat protein
MKKRTILTILITGIIMLAAAVGGYFLYTAKNRPPEVPLYLSMEEIQRDVETFEEIKAQRALSWQETFRLGVAYFHAGRLDDAVEALEEATRLRPGFPKSFESLGMAYFKLGELGNAVETWQKALALRPDATHLEDMIERAERRIEIDKRVSTLEKAVEEGRAGWKVRLELATLYVALRKLEEARVQLEEATKENKDSPELYDTLARVHAMEGDFEKAVEAEKKAFELKPEDEAIKKRLEEMEKLEGAVKEGGFHKSSK